MSEYSVGTGSNGGTLPDLWRIPVMGACPSCGCSGYHAINCPQTKAGMDETEDNG